MSLGARQTRTRANRAFTLVELLVSIAIFGVIIVLLGKTMSSIVVIWTRTSASVDNLSQARGALDNLQVDLSKAILRPDLAAFRDAGGNAVDGSGNAIVSFYAERPGISYDASQRQIGLVSYALMPSTGKARAMVLQRAITSVGWVAADIGFGDGTKLAAGTGTAYTQTLARGILAWAVKFLDGQGNIGSRYASSGSQAMTVSLLVIADRNDRALTALQRNALSQTFAEIETTAEAQQASVATLWQRKLTVAALGPGYPADLSGSLKVFERTYSLRNSP